MNKILFQGCAPAMVTPFKQGRVDFEALERIIEHLINNGIKTIVVLGTTGETSTLEYEEENEIIRFAKKRMEGRAIMIVGTGSNSTKTAVERSLNAKELGVDGLLVVTPYYNKCTQRGLVEYYMAIADTVKMPVIAYNVPSRTGLNMTPETALELSQNPYIVGLKEASGNIQQIIQLAKILQGKMALYSGDDVLNYLILALGGQGMISVTANALPSQLVALYAAIQEGNYIEARNLHNQLYEINNALFCEVNPIPVKAALCYMGICSDELRLPLTTIEHINRKKVIKALNTVLAKI